MKKLSECLNPEFIRDLQQKTNEKCFGNVSFGQAMQFLLTDGLLPEPDLPVQGFLKLEDWARSSQASLSVHYSATELKNKTGEILDQVLSGKTVILVKHGRPIAEFRKIEKTAV